MHMVNELLLALVFDWVAFFLLDARLWLRLLKDKVKCFSLRLFRSLINACILLCSGGTSSLQVHTLRGECLNSRPRGRLILLNKELHPFLLRQNLNFRFFKVFLRVDAQLLWKADAILLDLLVESRMVKQSAHTKYLSRWNVLVLDVILEFHTFRACAFCDFTVVVSTFYLGFGVLSVGQRVRVWV